MFAFVLLIKCPGFVVPCKILLGDSFSHFLKDGNIFHYDTVKTRMSMGVFYNNYDQQQNPETLTSL